MSEWRDELKKADECLKNHEWKGYTLHFMKAISPLLLYIFFMIVYSFGFLASYDLLTGVKAVSQMTKVDYAGMLFMAGYTLKYIFKSQTKTML
jgi:hypothetical protein